MDRKAADDNRNIPEQTESIIVRMSFLLVSSVSLGHILFCSKQIKGVIMVTWYSKQMLTRGYGKYFVPHPGLDPILGRVSRKLLYLVESVLSHSCNSPKCSTWKEFQL